MGSIFGKATVAPRPFVNTRLRQRYEEILCEAAYSNFRRFEVSARIT